MSKKWWIYALAGIVLAALVTGGMAIAGAAGSSGKATKMSKNNLAGQRLAKRSAEGLGCDECLCQEERNELRQENCEGESDETCEGNCEENRSRVENRGEATMNRNQFSENEQNNPADKPSNGCGEATRDWERLRDREMLRDGECDGCGGENQRREGEAKPN